MLSVLVFVYVSIYRLLLLLFLVPFRLPFPFPLLFIFPVLSFFLLVFFSFPMPYFRISFYPFIYPCILLFLRSPNFNCFSLFIYHFSTVLFCIFFYTYTFFPPFLYWLLYLPLRSFFLCSYIFVRWEEDIKKQHYKGGKHANKIDRETVKCQNISCKKADKVTEQWRIRPIFIYDTKLTSLKRV